MRSNSVLFFLVVCLSAAGKLGAHSPHDHIEAFAASPNFQQDGTILIVMRNHLFRTADGGKNWNRIARGLDNRFQFMAAAMDGSYAYLASKGDGVFKSTDGGESWNRANEGFGTSNIRKLLIAGKYVFASSKAKGVYRAEAGKEVWKVVMDRGEEDQVSAMAASADGMTLVAGDEQGGVSVSRDGGENWGERKIISEAGSIFSALVTGDGVVLLGTRRDGVMILDSDGSVSAFGEGLEGGAVTALAEFKAGPEPGSDAGGYFATTWDGGVFYRAANDGTWERRNKGTTKHVQADERGLPHFTDLAPIAGTSPGTVFLAAYDGLFRTEDAGRTWSEIETLPLSMILDFDVADAGGKDVALLVGTYWRGPVLSVDGGANWKAVGLGLAEEWQVKADQKLMRVQSVALSPNFAEDGTLYVGGRNSMMVSHDRGESWSHRDLGKLLGEQDLIVDRMVFSPRFKEDGVMFVAARAGHNETRRPAVFRSEDGGKTFKKVHEGDGEYAQCLVVSPGFAEDGVALWSSGADRGGSVYRSEDGGLTWVESEGGIELDVEAAELAISPDFTKDKTVFAGTSEGLFVSTNGGESWKKTKPAGLSETPYIETLAVSPAYAEDRTLVVAVRGDGHFITRDGGGSFSPIAQGLMEGNHLLTKAWYYSPSAVFRFSPHYAENRSFFGTTGMEVMRSLDDGKTWELLEARGSADSLEGVRWGVLVPWIAGAVAALILLGCAFTKARKRIKRTAV